MGQLHEVAYLSAMTTYCSIQTTNHKQSIFKSAQIPITHTSSASDFQGNGIPVVKPIRQVPSLRYRDYPFSICLYLGGECGDRTGSGGSCRSRGRAERYHSSRWGMFGTAFLYLDAPKREKAIVCGSTMVIDELLRIYHRCVETCQPSTYGIWAGGVRLGLSKRARQAEPNNIRPRWTTPDLQNSTICMNSTFNPYATPHNFYNVRYGRL